MRNLVCLRLNTDHFHYRLTNANWLHSPNNCCTALITRYANLEFKKKSKQQCKGEQTQKAGMGVIAENAQLTILT